MKQIARIAALVLGTFAGLALLWQFREAVVVFILSLATAAATRPVINFLMQRGIRDGWALLMTYLSLSILVVGLMSILDQPLIDDLEQTSNNLAVGYENFYATWSTSDERLKATIASQLPPAEALFEAISGEEGLQTLQGLLGTASNLAGILSQAVVIIILSIYWSSDRVHFERLWMSLIPVKLRVQARNSWREIESGVGNYILGEVVQSYLVIVILWAGFGWIGLPQPALLALICAFFWFIPWLGAVLALIPVIFMGMSVSIPAALLAAALTIATLALMELLIQPYFYTRQRYNSLFMALVVIIMAQAFGILGIILAPALAAALEIGFLHLANNRKQELRAEQISEEVSQLKARMQALQQRVQLTGASNSPELENLTERLRELLDKTTRYLMESGENLPEDAVRESN